MRLLALVCLAVLAGCASSPSPKWVSSKTGAVEGSDEFIMEEAQCRTMARGANPTPARGSGKETFSDAVDEGVATMNQNRVTDACLRTRGWFLSKPAAR